MFKIFNKDPPERHQWHRSGVFIVSFEYTSHLFYCFYNWLWATICLLGFLLLLLPPNRFCVLIQCFYCYLLFLFFPTRKYQSKVNNDDIELMSTEDVLVSLFLTLSWYLLNRFVSITKQDHLIHKRYS